MYMNVPIGILLSGCCAKDDDKHWVVSAQTNSHHMVIISKCRLQLLKDNSPTSSLQNEQNLVKFYHMFHVICNLHEHLAYACIWVP